MRKEPEVKERRQAMIGNVHVVEVEPGTKVFDFLTEKLLGIVEDRKPVINGKTAYISTNDYEAAKRALPAAPKTLPGLPGSPTKH